METYPVDIDPAQVVRWLKAEYEAEPALFRITARRMTEAQDLPARREFHLGDQEREDLAEVTTLATLEIAPASPADGWQLTITVEDDVGPRFVGESADEQRIDLGSFYGEFVRTGRGNMTVSAEVVDSSASARLEELLNAVETNRHPP